MSESGPESMFDVGKLKVLPNAQLVGALIDEAHLAVADMPRDEQANLNSMVSMIYWLPTEEEQAVINTQLDDVGLMLGKLASTIIKLSFGEKLDPEEAIDRLNQIRKNLASDRISSLKDEITNGISNSDGMQSGWSEERTKFNLLQICDEQREAGIESELDYVHDTALDHLSSSGSRSVVLISNALCGDSKSLVLGLGYLREGLEAGSLGWDDASEGLSLISECIRLSPLDEMSDLKDTALDLLARLRQLKGTIPSYTNIMYAMAAAELAVTLRDHDSSE